jgi:hypothetical protein
MIYWLDGTDGMAIMEKYWNRMFISGKPKVSSTTERPLKKPAT